MYRDKITNDPEEAKNQIISFLEKKYGKEFVPLSIEMDRWPYHYDDLGVYPKGGDKKKDGFNAYRERKNGKYVFRDCYFGVLIHDEYVEKVQNIAEEFFPQCKVIVNYTHDTLPNEINSSYTLQDVIDMKVDYTPEITIRVAPTFDNIEDFDNNVDLFMPKLIESKIKGGMVIQYFKNNDLDIDVVDNGIYQKRIMFKIDSDFRIKQYK